MKSKREIKVLEEEYLWVLDGNTTHGYNEGHIRIHAQKLTKRILYLDPYNWHFEVRPQTIRKAILFAINNGWNPKEKGAPLYLAMKGDGDFYVLPEGVKFGYLDK